MRIEIAARNLVLQLSAEFSQSQVISMLEAVVTLGICALVALAVEIGRRQALDAAWRRVAAARRRLNETSRHLVQRETEQDARDLALDARQRQLVLREQELVIRGHQRDRLRPDV